MKMTSAFVNLYRKPILRSMSFLFTSTENNLSEEMEVLQRLKLGGCKRILVRYMHMTALYETLRPKTTYSFASYGLQIFIETLFGSLSILKVSLNYH